MPANYIRTTIQIYAWGITTTTPCNVCIIEDKTWGEFSMTWSNRPAHGEVIANGLVSSERYYLIDVTDYVESRNNISICIYCTDPFLDDWIYIDSRESPFAEDRPRLIWTYIVSEVVVADDGDDDDDDDKEAEEIPLITLIGIIGGSIAAGEIAVIIAWKKQLFTKGRKKVKIYLVRL